MATYKKAIVSYLDILGFRHLIKESEKSNKKVNEVLETLRTTKRKTDFTVGAVDADTFQPFTQTQNFSDLIVRTTPTNAQEDLVPRLNMELMILAGIQCQLAKRGILLRGGVSCMDIYDQDGFIFGPALVRSYDLAENVAVFPRIVIDPDLTTSDNAYQGNWKRGEDGVFFIDYLTVCYTNFGGFTPSGFDSREEIIPAHKATVEKKLNELSRKDERVRQKAIWLALYHNSVINTLASQSPDKGPILLPLRISEEQLVHQAHTTTPKTQAQKSASPKS